MGRPSSSWLSQREGERERGREGKREGVISQLVKQYFTISLFIFLSLSSSRPEDLMNDMELAAGTPVEHQVIFSFQSDIYISKNSNTSQADFKLFMNRAPDRARGSQVYTCTIYMYSTCIHVLYM